ncbi:GMC family oxidoreductase N-terminal domain-containing protein [Lentzea sp. NPDC051208]|uniref:GMC family oxidoreductase n=1 Tax=Lentzea sp. NPDC051208 TaxID=3154642 RepID=UPI00343586D6
MRHAEATYDNIVVGAGSAGAPLVRRLVNAGRRVLLIEAGEPVTRSGFDKIELSLRSLWRTEVDWGYDTEPQQHADGQRLHWPRGKTLGGSSAICGLVYTRGLASDYDGWAAAGCDGWDYASVVRSFVASEDFSGPRSAHRGVGGLLPVSTNQSSSPVSRAFIAAAKEWGVPEIDDYNTAEPLGASMCQHTVRDGRRMHAWEVFGKDVESEPGLTIHTGAFVTKLLFAGEKCIGVSYQVGGQERRAYADDDIVLSAGVVGSPRILLASGIGPADDLSSLGIDVRVDLPSVGANLHDHVRCSVVWSAKKPVQAVPGLVAEAHVFWRSKPALAAPDLLPLLLTIPVPVDGYPLVNQGFSCSPIVVGVHSRGRLRLRSADPAVPPAIDPAIFSDTRDLDAMVACLEMVREIGAQQAFDEWRAEEIAPGRGVRDRSQLRAYAKRVADTPHHPAGTCRMGNDPDAVVDPQLRVQGVGGLRVADVSIMPSVTSGNTNAPAIMIGERAAEFLLNSDLRQRR